VIKCHLSKYMGENKLKISDLQRETKLHRNSITLLYKETATRIDLDTMNALCKYFKCDVSDLFEYVSDDED